MVDYKLLTVWGLPFYRVVYGQLQTLSLVWDLLFFVLHGRLHIVASVGLTLACPNKETSS